ncbi:hypothetical protein [Clostridium minihomine]|uniref:hypothetical protein n=1 Tax=Clostridium minihomine TaxID=2045012 RepID=UPI000C794BDE|nr:hypothetical protein [Clostridium minihomine]
MKENTVKKWYPIMMLAIIWMILSLFYSKYGELFHLLISPSGYMIANLIFLAVFLFGTYWISKKYKLSNRELLHDKGYLILMSALIILVLLNFIF